MQRIVCGSCKHVLYEGVEIKPPDEIIQKFGGVCPKCGNKLKFNPKKVKFSPSSNYR